MKLLLLVFPVTIISVHQWWAKEQIFILFPSWKSEHVHLCCKFRVFSINEAFPRTNIEFIPEMLSDISWVHSKNRIIFFVLIISSFSFKVRSIKGPWKTCPGRVAELWIHMLLETKTVFHWLKRAISESCRQ